VVATRHAQLDAVEVDLATWLDRPPFADQVARLAADRGVTRLGGLTLAAEVGDWRRFARAAQFMGFCGLVPSEYSSGHSVHRGRLTKAGNAHLRAQLAWVGLDLPASTVGGPRDCRPPARAGPRGGRPRMGRAAAPSARFRALAARKNTKSIVAAAIARELAGFLWAEMVA
jgi:transposase